MTDHAKIILASGSPRRRQLLSELLDGFGLPLTVDPISDVDESHSAEIPAGEVAPTLALRKLKTYITRRLPADSDIIISADTVVILGNEVLGKPADEAEARQMLNRLSGRSHQVITGIAIAKGRQILSVDRQTTEVTFANLSPDEIDRYIDRYRPFDKAGSYGIQEWIGKIGIERIEGDFYNVVGLPLQLLYSRLRPLLSQS